MGNGAMHLHRNAEKASPAMRERPLVRAKLLLEHAGFPGYLVAEHGHGRRQDPVGHTQVRRLGPAAFELPCVALVDLAQSWHMNCEKSQLFALFAVGLAFAPLVIAVMLLVA